MFILPCYTCSLFFQSGYTSQGSTRPSSKSYEPTGEVRLVVHLGLSGIGLSSVSGSIPKLSVLGHGVADSRRFQYFLQYLYC